MYINISVKHVTLLLRLVMGWLFFYAGFSKIMNPDWTSAGYLSNAQTLPELFSWFADPSRIGIVDFLNQWGLLLIGVALILGWFVSLASFAGIILMILYWLPLLNFPYVGNGFIVDDHIIYIVIFMYLWISYSGSFVGIDRFRR